VSINIVVLCDYIRLNLCTKVAQQIEDIIDAEVEAQVQAQLGHHLPPTLLETVVNNQQQLHDVQYSLHNA
jgi:hypothetical protein